MSSRAERLVGKGSPFELVEAVIEGVPYNIFKHAPSTLPDLYKRARLSDGREFLIADTRRMSYREVFSQADALANILVRNYQVGSGSRVALVLGNVPEWVTAFIGITATGATAVTVHRNSHPEHVLAAIRDAECAVVICDEEIARMLRNAGESRRIILVRGNSTLSAEDLMQFPGAESDKTADAELKGNGVHPEQVGLIAFTSGSTGQPKGVELTHRSIITGLMNMLLGAGIASLEDATAAKFDSKRAPPASLVVGPLSHISGYANLLLTLYCGGRLALVRSCDGAGIAEMLCSDSVTSLVGATPGTMQEMVREMRSRSGGRSLRSIVVQGAAMQPALLNEIQSLLPQVTVYSGYGMTETSGSVCVASGRALQQHPDAVGRPLPTVQLRIVREDGSDAASGDSGEVWLRGAMLFRGYCADLAGTHKALPNGWLRTGDVGRLDETGVLHIVDRVAEIAVCRGVKISCPDIERAVKDSSLAEEVVAFGVSGASVGERVVIALVRGTMDQVSPSKIMEVISRAGIQGVVGPIVVHFDSLPRTISGKVDRAELRRRALEGASKLESVN